jgi:phosphatidylserine decarboxylase
LTENHFNEENWLILQSEFGRIVKVEIGAVIKNEEDFDWKFNA